MKLSTRGAKAAWPCLIGLATLLGALPAEARYQSSAGHVARPHDGPEAARADSEALTDGTLDCLGGVIDGADIDNGTIRMGVTCYGYLNTRYVGVDPLGIGYLGMRFMPTGFASVEPGCQCEGWGVANGCSGLPGEVQGYGNVSSDGGAVGLGMEQFLYSADQVLSTVLIPPSSPVFRVTHDYHPSPVTSFAYEVIVTVENLTATAQPLYYRRVQDWDIGPTHFNEYVTIDAGTAAYLIRTHANGFNSSNPCVFDDAGGFYVPGPLPGEPPLVDAGPMDHGALFDFKFPDLGPAELRQFVTYYGATPSEVDATDTMAAIGAEAYSFGQPNCPGGSTDCRGLDGPRDGQPNTFFFAFGMVGGSPAFCGNGVVEEGEACDDGNTLPGDGCRADCTIEACADGILDPGEA